MPRRIFRLNIPNGRGCFQSQFVFQSAGVDSQTSSHRQQASTPRNLLADFAQLEEKHHHCASSCLPLCLPRARPANQTGLFRFLRRSQQGGLNQSFRRCRHPIADSRRHHIHCFLIREKVRQPVSSHHAKFVVWAEGQVRYIWCRLDVGV